MASRFQIFGIEDNKVVDTGRFEKRENRDVNDGYPILNSTGVLLVKGDSLGLSRNVSNNFGIFERTSNEFVVYYNRVGQFDFRGYIRIGGNWYEMAYMPVSQSQLKTATGRLTGSAPMGGGVNVSLGVEYSFFPNIVGNQPTTIGPYYNTSEITDQIGRFRIYGLTNQGVDYWVRFRYIASSLDGLVVLYDNGRHVVSLPTIDDEKLINHDFIRVFNEKGKEIPVKREVIYPVNPDNIDTIINQVKVLNVDLSEFKERIISYNNSVKEKIRPPEQVW
jgi:hypothetical protein